MSSISTRNGEALENPGGAGNVQGVDTSTQAHAPAPVSPYLNEVQAAAYLNIKPSTLRRWRMDGGRGPVFVKIGRDLVRYRIEHLNAFAMRGVRQ